LESIGIAAAVVVLGQIWKKLPLPFAIAAAIGGAVYHAFLHWNYDTIELSPQEIICRSGKKEWRLAYASIFRIYKFREQWIFETNPPHKRFSFRFQGHEQHLNELLNALEGNARTMNLAWVEWLSALRHL